MFMITLGVAAITFLLCLFPAPRTYISRFARAVWVCRISAISVGLGTLLFARAPPARDLFAEVNAGALYWAVFFALVLAWALYVHYAARKALEQQAWAAGSHPLPLAKNIAALLKRQFAFIGTWLPRLLGLACFIAVGWGTIGAEKTSALMDASGGAVHSFFLPLEAATVATAVLFVLIAIFRRLYSTPLMVLLKGDPDAVIAEPSPIWFLDFLFSRQQRATRTALYGGVKADWIAIAIVTVVALCFLASMFMPLAFGYLVPRAWFIPVVLGLPVFPLSIVTAFSHRLCFPILLLLVLVLGGLAVLAPSFHDARTMVTSATGASARQIELKEALDRWGQSNCRPAGSSEGDCARYPIIVALAGGASRASFLSATVVGDILDTTHENPAFRDFGAQMFAISGVSGGSLGAAVIRSALVDAAAGGKALCKSTDASWYGFQGRGSFSRFSIHPVQQDSWKACLQSLAAGDFLSPAVLGLAFRDPWTGFFGLAEKLGIDSDDRAALLERAVEVRYATLLAEPTSFAWRFGTMIGSDPELANRRGLARPLGYTAAATRWMPLLLLNATSVDTGRRVIASELLPSYSDGNGHKRRVFPEAYDLFEELLPERDIPLATAAILSARFPVISPYGALRSNDPRRPSERAVDGGYFENDGVTTALQLALAIRQLRPEMNPVILHVTNDPVQRAGDNVSDGGMPAHEPPPMTPRKSRWFESLINPVTALFGTRSGHAAQAVEAARAAEGIKYVRFQVFDTAPQPAQGARTGSHLQEKAPPSSGTTTPIDDVSMSWWLSGAVQDYLDRQLCHQSNKDAWVKLSSWLKKTE
jgi:hypothetical protein